MDRFPAVPSSSYRGSRRFPSGGSCDRFPSPPYRGEPGTTGLRNQGHFSSVSGTGPEELPLPRGPEGGTIEGQPCSLTLYDSRTEVDFSYPSVQNPQPIRPKHPPIVYRVVVIIATTKMRRGSREKEVWNMDTPSLHAVLQSTTSIPQAGIHQGDFLLIRPGHADPIISCHYPSPAGVASILCSLASLRPICGNANLEMVRHTLMTALEEAEEVPPLLLYPDRGRSRLA